MLHCAETCCAVLCLISCTGSLSRGEGGCGRGGPESSWFASGDGVIPMMTHHEWDGCCVRHMSVAAHATRAAGAGWGVQQL